MKRQHFRSTDRVKILYIAGAGRSGSTLLEQLIVRNSGLFWRRRNSIFLGARRWKE